MAARKSKASHVEEEEDDISEDMDTSIDLFWKGTVKPDEPLTVSGVEDYFVHITNASLGPDAKENTRTSLGVTDEESENPSIVCTLKNNYENHQLNVLVTASTQFCVLGTNPSPIYLVGYLSPAEQYISENPFDMGDLEGMEEDEEVEDAENELQQFPKSKQQAKLGQKRKLTEMVESEVAGENEKQLASANKKQKGKDGKAKPTPPEKKETPNNNQKNQNNQAQNKNQKQNQQANKKPNEEKPKESEAVEPEETPKSSPDKEAAEAKKDTNETAKNKPVDQWKSFAEGLKYKDIKEGAGKAVRKGSKVSVYYVGQLPNKQVFDKMISGEGLEFKVGGGEVIQGWEKGLIGMKVGGKRRLLVPAKLGYGQEGSQPEIPPNTDLTFTIEVKSVN